MLSTDRSFIFFHKPGFALHEAEQELRKSKMTVTKTAEMLTVVWGNDNPELFVKYVQGESIQREAVRMGRDSLYAGMLRECDSAFEITFHDLDAVLDEI